MENTVTVARPIGRRVLAEQLMVKRESSLTLPSTNSDKPNSEEFDVSFKLLALGMECPQNELKPGDKIILDKNAVECSAKLVEKSEDGSKIVMHVFLYYDDVIGVD